MNNNDTRIYRHFEAPTIPLLVLFVFVEKNKSLYNVRIYKTRVGLFRGLFFSTSDDVRQLESILHFSTRKKKENSNPCQEDWNIQRARVSAMTSLWRAFRMHAVII